MGNPDDVANVEQEVGNKEYGLARIVWGSPAFLPISEEEYRAIAKARIVLREVLYIEQKFDFLICNYMEFEHTLVEAGLQGMVLGANEYSWFFSMRGQFDRRIMNLLTTAISYSDTAPQHVNHIFNCDAQVTDAARKLYSHEYDSRLGYRTMCKLRNFVQHQGLPVHGTSLSMNRFGEGDDRKIRYTVSPYISPKELREGEFNRNILAELESVGEQIDLKLLARDYLDGLAVAHNGLREMLAEVVAGAEATIEEAIRSYEKAFPVENSIIGLAAVRCEPGPVYKDDLAIARDANEYRLQLAKKNRMRADMARSYLSTEVTVNRY